MVLRLPPEIAQKLDMPEGSAKIGFVSRVPLDAPKGRTTLIAEVSPANTLVRIDLDERMHVYFVRQAPGLEPAEVFVDASSMRGATRLHFWLVWSPMGMAIHVVDRDSVPVKMVSGTLGRPAD